MPQSFKDQGGAATMSPNPITRWLTSKILTRLTSPQHWQKKRQAAEQQRRKTGAKHVVEYFHQVDDAYSQLCVQILPQLCQRYDIELRCHLVTGPTGNNAAEPQLLSQLSRYDVHHVAPAYGLQFPSRDTAPHTTLIQLATNILASLDADQFVTHAASVGHALWDDDLKMLNQLSQSLGCFNSVQTQVEIQLGNARQTELKHYAGAMFYYAKEWYWGVDRLYHLEKRFIQLGISNQLAVDLLLPRPAICTGNKKDNGALTLEIFPSLRSPYTAISFDSAVKLATDTGIQCVIRPVLPMVMRGVPATREKGLYIFFDAAREAYEAGTPFHQFYDPIGDPVCRGYSLFPWASSQGKAVAFISSFLKTAFVQGIYTGNNRGMKHVVEQAGLNWQQAKTHIDQKGWQDILEQNRQDMYQSGLWGVPSFRLLNAEGKPLITLWGQDRLWLMARKIEQHLSHSF